MLYSRNELKIFKLKKEISMQIEIARKIAKFFVFQLFFPLQPAFVTLAKADIIPPSRCVAWHGNVGIKGDIPNRTKIFANVKEARYNAVGDGIKDDTRAIQKAITDCPAGQVVYLPAGTYKITRGLLMKSNITLRGAGTDSTTIKGASGFPDTHLIAFMDYEFIDDELYQTAKSISGGLSKGSSSITVASHGYEVGDIILIDQLNDVLGDPLTTTTGTSGTCTWCSRSNGDRGLGQVVEIASVPNVNTIGLDIPLYFDFDESRSPQVSRVNPSYLIKFAGIERIQVDNSLSANDSQENYGAIYMHAAVNCWMLNVTINTVYRAGLVLRYGSYRNIIRGCQIHKSNQYASNIGYGIWFYYGVSACLFENNIFNELSAGILYNGPVSGNVISYNYFTKIISTDYPNAVRIAIAHHGGHPMMNLFEGNFLDGPCVAADYYWGSSSHNTYLRNRVALDIKKTDGIADIDIWKGQTYYSFVGNILGTNGFETKYEDNDLYDGKMIYCLDYTNRGSQDGKTAKTILRHGNFDFVNDKIIWDASITDRNIPNSYYLTEKPSWWGSLSWPPIGPDCNPMSGEIPAKSRFEANSSTPQPPGSFRFIK